MQVNPKASNRWRDRLQVAAQLAAIGSFLAAIVIVSLSAANYLRAPVEVLIHRSAP